MHAPDARLTRAHARVRARYAQEAADALYEKAMQFCSNELPVRRRKSTFFSVAAAPVVSRRARCSAHITKYQYVRTTSLAAPDGPAPRALPPQPKMAADAGQTGSLATFMNGKLSTKPLAVRRSPSALAPQRVTRHASRAR